MGFGNQTAVLQPCKVGVQKGDPSYCFYDFKITYATNISNTVKSMQEDWRSSSFLTFHSNVVYVIVNISAQRIILNMRIGESLGAIN